MGNTLFNPSTIMDIATKSRQTLSLDEFTDINLLLDPLEATEMWANNYITSYKMQLVFTSIVSHPEFNKEAEKHSASNAAHLISKGIYGEIWERLLILEQMLYAGRKTDALNLVSTLLRDIKK